MTNMALMFCRTLMSAWIETQLQAAYRNQQKVALS